VGWSYDAAGNQLSDGASTLTITYGYDGLHRLTAKTYSNAEPAVGYSYDQSSYNGLTITSGKGRRTGMSWGTGGDAGLAAWTYDATGQATTERRSISGVTRNIGYQYNENGSLYWLTNPSGRQLRYLYNAAGQATHVQHMQCGGNLLIEAQYAPHGALSSARMGYGVSPCGVYAAYNGTYVTQSYNKRLQPIEISAAGPPSVGTIMSFSYDFELGVGNNGNVKQIVNNLVPDRTQNFTYDSLNRIREAWTSGNLWGNYFEIDLWGNLTKKSHCVTSCVGKPLGEWFQQTADNNNRIVGWSYDAAGNQLSDGVNTFTYDAESRMKTAAGVTYVYDGDGRRVKKSSGMLYWHDLSGNVIEETNLSGTLLDTYAFFNGQRAVRWGATAGDDHYYFSNHLGSATVITDEVGGSREESDYYPYGGEIVISNTDPNRYKFTGKERDGESGLDYFIARHYSPASGRFLQADEYWGAPGSNDPLPPGPLPYTDLYNPQSLNRYSYTLNNPTAYVDDDGHCPNILECAPEVAPTPTSPPPQPSTPPPQPPPQAPPPVISIPVLGMAVVVGLLAQNVINVTADTVQAKADDEMTEHKAANNNKIIENEKKGDEPPKPQTEGGGARKGGGRNERKSNIDRVEAAKREAAGARAELDRLNSTPVNQRSPNHAELVRKAQGRLNRAVDRQKRSETHSRREKR
jgi:RHS repeat-associated protein